MAQNPRLIVELFRDKYFQGTKATVIQPVESLATIGMTDVVSSLKVFHGPGASASPNQRAMFYEHAQYQGRRLVLPPGYYPDVHAIPYNFGDIIASINFSPSATITAPQYGWVPLIAEVYQDLNYRGRMATILRDVSYFGEIGMNDSVSSLRVSRGPNFPFAGCRIVFFQNPDYEGAQLSVALGPRDFSLEFPNLHDHPQRFGDTISSARILPTGTFNVLVVEGDTRTREPGMLGAMTKIESNTFTYTHVRINHNLDNYGSPEAHPFSRIAQRLSEFDIIWFTWNAPGHDLGYFLTPADEYAIKEWVKAGGILWASSADDRIFIPEGEQDAQWKGGWLPVERHPARVVNSADVKVWMTREGRRTGLFTWPHRVNLDTIVTDDHWVTTDPTYVILARRDDNQEPIAALLPWGNGFYVLFAIDTRDERAAEAARPLMANALCYLASLAWASSPRQPLRGRQRMVG